MEEAPRRTSLVPLAFPCFVHYLIGVETEGFYYYQGQAGIISIVQWNLRPVIFGVDSCSRLYKNNGAIIYAIISLLGGDSPGEPWKFQDGSSGE